MNHSDAIVKESDTTTCLSRRVDAPTLSRLAALLVALFTGCDPPGTPNAADRPVPPEDVVDFAALYCKNCAGCHGADGKLGPAPPLNDSLFRAIVPERELHRVVSAGRPGTPMPAFAIANGGTLTPSQIQVLVCEIKGIPYKLATETAGPKQDMRLVRDAQGIQPKWGAPESVSKSAPAYLQAGSTSTPTAARCEQIRATVFARACAGCHGDSGQGGKRAGPINDRTFLKLISDQALRRLILTGRDDLGMPDYAGIDGRPPDFKRLTSSEVGQLVELLAAWRVGGIAGAEPRMQTGNSQEPGRE